LLEDPDPDLPPLPSADENGHYSAIETARVIIARQVIRGRKAAGWTQVELAARAGVRQETISRIETGKHSPGLKTMAKIDRALNGAGV
jgi:DNA-binding XRE family transcriptional regulator